MPEILLFGGTTEGRKAAGALEREKLRYIYSTKTRTDFRATAHPFAGNLHQAVARVLDGMKIPVIRYERKYPERINHKLVIYCDNYAQSHHSGVILVKLRGMKAALYLKVGQTTTMTPQLQQAIRILQLSTLELQSEIQQALESNMMLEMDEEDEHYTPDQTTADAAVTEETEQPVNGEPDNIPDELAIDYDWEDAFESGGMGLASPVADGATGIENQKSDDGTLQDQLLWQLNLMTMSRTQRNIAVAIIDALDNDGYLHTELDDLCSSLDDDRSTPISAEDMETALQFVQSMEPPGVAARSLRECLLIQLRQCDAATPFMDSALRLLSEYIEVLANKDFLRLMRKLNLTREELERVIALIRSMNPRPGAAVSTTRTEYITPDVFVKKVKGRWRVELNQDLLPRLKINAHYAGMVRRGRRDEDNLSLKAHLQEARWFIKSLRSRNETLLRIAACIVKKQRTFLEYGEEAMKPMVLQDIARILDLHESTVSRGTKNKYIHTPRGIFELKYFFSSHLSTHNGGEASSTAIRAFIKKLIGAEVPQKPLSDNKISLLLAEQGIAVARRTVAKYREAMAIPPSNERRQLS